MKRAGLTALVALLALLALLALPMAAMATPGTPSGGQDQFNDWNESWFAPDNATDPVIVTQTYKSKMAGRLTGVQIYCQQVLQDSRHYAGGQLLSDDITVSVGSSHASGTCGGSGWMTFTFSSGPAQTVGGTGTISITFAAGHTIRIGVGGDYADGAASGSNVPGDFAFATWVGTNPPPTSTETDQGPAGGSSLWLVPGLLALALGTLVAIRRRMPATKR